MGQNLSAYFDTVYTVDNVTAPIYLKDILHYKGLWNIPFSECTVSTICTLVG